MFSNVSLSKYATCAAIGTVGACLATFFGGWTQDFKILLILMGIDYAMGLTIAIVYKKSPKSKNGCLSSAAGTRGIVKKCGTLVCVIVAVQLDALMNTNYLRSLVIITLAVNELISLVENLGIMGVKLPKSLLKAIDVLKSKTDDENKDEGAGE